MRTDDPAKLSAALEQLEAEKQRRIDERIAKGEVISMSPIVVGMRDGLPGYERPAKPVK
jgi:hypothetical protein